MSTWKFFVEIVQVLSQVATVFITGFAAWVAYQTLLKTPNQKSMGNQDEDSGGDGIEKITLLKVFETRKQLTTLVVETDGIKCKLEDKASGENKFQWGYSKAAIRKILDEKDFRAHAGFKAQTGTFSLGARRNWLYSKSLFPTEEDLEFELERILRSAVED